MKARSLILHGSLGKLQSLYADYHDRQGMACDLKPGQLIVHPRWNRENLKTNK